MPVPAGRIFGWTQPSCRECYVARNPGRDFVALKNPDKEICVYCAKTTFAGIYVRIDPTKAPYPSLTKEGS